MMRISTFPSCTGAPAGVSILSRELRRVFSWFRPRLSFLLTAMAGLLNMYAVTFFSGFQVIQGDGKDALLNHYFLEHGYRWAFFRDYPFPLWSPPYYFPMANALALSDNLLGVAPIYWLFRFFFPPQLSYQLWLMALSLLSFAAMKWVLTRLGASRLPALAGGYLFAFGLGPQSQMAHPQLLGQFYAPLALFFLFRHLHTPASRWLALTAVFFLLQLIAGIYLGWFLMVGLACFAAAALLTDAGLRRRFFAHLLRNGVQTGGILLGAVGVALLFLGPYLQMSRQLSGGWTLDEIQAFLLPVQAWMLPNPQSLPHAAWMPAGLFPAVMERPHTMGLCAWMLAAGLGVHSIRPRSREGLPESVLFCRLCWMTFLLLVAVSVRWPGGFSAWTTLYRLIPGARAIRAMNRIWVVAHLFLISGGMLAWSAILSTKSSRFRAWASAAFLVLMVLENTRAFQNHADPEPGWRRIAVLAETLRGADAGYIVAAIGRNGAIELVEAMWAGLEAQVPVVNGLASRHPPGYPEHTLFMTVAEIQDWIGEIPIPLRLRVIRPYDSPFGDDWLTLTHPGIEAGVAPGPPPYRFHTVYLPFDISEALEP